MTLTDNPTLNGAPAPAGSELKLPRFLQRHADDPKSLTNKLDLMLLAGCVLASTMFLGPIGVPLMIYTLVILRRMDKAGLSVRPWMITIVGAVILLDTGAAWIGWAIDLLPTNRSVLGRIMYETGYGPLFDGGYYLDYNSTWLGGTPVVIEKMWEFLCLLFLYPIRMAGVWGFMKMKRWGFQVTVMSLWMYCIVWICYMVGYQMNFSQRMGASQFGLVGYWVADIFYASCFLLLPYFYFVNREAWSSDGLDADEPGNATPSLTPQGEPVLI